MDGGNHGDPQKSQCRPEIRTQHLPTTNVERYRSINQLGLTVATGMLEYYVIHNAFCDGKRNSSQRNSKMILYILPLQQAIHRPLPSSSVCGFPFEFSCANSSFWLYISKFAHTLALRKLMPAGATSETTIIYFKIVLRGYILWHVCYYVTSTFSEGSVNTGRNFHNPDFQLCFGLAKIIFCQTPFIF
jgi:hypothetical protein